MVYRFYCMALFHSQARRHMINQSLSLSTMTRCGVYCNLIIIIFIRICMSQGYIWLMEDNICITLLIQELHFIATIRSSNAWTEFTFRHLNKGVQEFQRTLVVAPTHNTANNVVMHYINILNSSFTIKTFGKNSKRLLSNIIIFWRL